MWFNLPIQIKKFVAHAFTHTPTVVEFGVFSSFGHPPLIEEAILSDEKYIGITTSQDQFKKLTEAYTQNHNISIKYLASPRLFATNILPESADLVVFSNSFHKFIDQQSLLSEVNRILKPDGVLALAQFSLFSHESKKHVNDHKDISKYSQTIIPFEDSLGVSVELYKKN